MSPLSEITSRRNGFTLAELLVAVTVAVILMGCLGTVYSTVTRISEHSGERLEAWREARGVLALLERDLKFLAAPGETGAPWLVYSPAEQEVAFHAMTAGGPGRIKYRCVWNPEARTWCLKRFWHEGLEGNDAWVEEEVATHLWDFSISTDTPGEAELPGPPPRWVEVRFRVVGERVAARMKSLPVTAETWTQASDPIHQQMIQPYRQEFVQKIRLGMAEKRL